VRFVQKRPRHGSSAVGLLHVAGAGLGLWGLRFPAGAHGMSRAAGYMPLSMRYDPWDKRLGSREASVCATSENNYAIASSLS
jgi:hypothetical protein